MTFVEAAEQVLRTAGEPLHYEEITKRALAQGLLTTTGKTPAATLNAQIVVSINTKGDSSPFVRVRPAVFALREWGHEKSQGEVAEEEVLTPPREASPEARRVRIPVFPVYSSVRWLLPVLAGRPRAQMQGLLSRLAELRGTPQEPEDWTNPDEWIGQRLAGEDQDLARAIWEQSERHVNPRHTYGVWYLIRGHTLLAADAAGILRLTDRGQDFLTYPEGATVALLDREEGLVKLLAIAAAKGAGKRSDFLPDWSAYLQAYSNFGTDSTFKDTLRRRLLNLVERELLARRGNIYEITPRGLAYLEKTGGEEAAAIPTPSELHALYQLAEQQRQAVREQLAARLAQIDPYQFEHLIRRLLEEMGYQNVEVTAPTNDKGVDVVGDIELGITAVREVIQVKRHAGNIQRPVLDALRGSLHRFRAVRGTIIATSDFSKGTKDAAFEPGAAPITLINGEKLLDLLFEYGLGVRKKTIEVWETDEDAFAASEEEAS
ncbi:MAG: restriction endonuclease [Anaerolineae bacterium]|nr:restriction endonuclease [Anaerolineae bacterium]